MINQPAGGHLTQNTFQTPCGLTIRHLNKAETAFVYKEIFQERVYLRHGISIREHDCIFDVGANIGLFTVFVQENFRGVKSFAFEPSPEVFAVLQANVAKYGASVAAHPCGLSSKPGQATFTFYPSYSILSGFHGDAARDAQTVRSGILNQWRQRFPGSDDPDPQYLEDLIQRTLGDKREFVCQLRTISQIVRENAINEISLLKVDTEGSEWDVLAGIDAEHWPIIRQCVIEVHDAGPTLQAITELLVKHGFQCHVEQEKNLQSSGIVNLYATR